MAKNGTDKTKTLPVLYENKRKSDWLSMMHWLVMQRQSHVYSACNLSTRYPMTATMAETMTIASFADSSVMLVGSCARWAMKVEPHDC